MNWRETVDWAIGAVFQSSCWACGLPAAVGDRGPWCTACGVAVEAGPKPATGAWPIAGFYVYAGAVADAIAAAKAHGRPLPLDGIGRSWRQHVRRLAQHCKANAVCAVAPEQRRLAQRGWHLPDQLARRSGVAVQVALSRLDHAAPRRLDRETPPSFGAKAGRGRVLLIDDVVTTGETLQRAAEALRSAGWTPVGAAVLADARPASLAEVLGQGEIG